MAMVILLFLLLLPLATAQPWQLCGDRGDYTANSTYQLNLRLLSSTLPKKASSNSTLFAADTAGNAPDTVYALALCRGDTSDPACADCVATAFQDAHQLCAYSKEATVYYDPCMLSFSNRNILAGTVNEKVAVVMNMQNFTTSADSVRLSLFTLLNSTAQSAASSPKRFTTSRLDVSSVPTLYCLMQCTPDLTAEECAACFQDFSQLTLKFLDGPQGGRLIGLRCNMRYEVYQFFHGNPMLRIANLAAAVQVTNNTTSGTPVAVYPQPQRQALAAAPPPEAPTTVQEHHGASRPPVPIGLRET